MNINTRVRVKLTSKAKEILKKADLYEQPDDQDILETELWCLMRVFGPHFYHGMTFDLFVGNDIEFVTEAAMTP
jgi:hypothetical protein